MSYLDALAYPLRGKNIWSLLGLSIIYMIMTVLLAVMKAYSASNIANMGFSILLTAYYWSTLKELFEGNSELPNIVLAFVNFRQAVVINLAQIGYVFIVGLAWFALLSVDANLALLALLLLGALVYLLVAVGTIRYAIEDRWIVLLDVFENVRLLMIHPLKCLKLLFFNLGLLVTAFLSIFVTTSVLSVPSYVFGSIDSTLLGIALGIAMSIIMLHLILAHTYLLYGFGLELEITGHREKEKYMPLDLMLSPEKNVLNKEMQQIPNQS